MSVRQPTDSGLAGSRPRRRRIPLETAVQAAMHRGYNIGGFGCFIGAAYPLVVRTALGIAKCNPDELELV
jgi:hypothetical protein